MLRILLVLALLPAVLFAQTGERRSEWAPLKYFVGTWEGTATSRVSIGTATREFRFILGGSFLESAGKTVYEASAQLPEGQTREELGFFSYDRARKTLVLRQFHPEGQVSQYTLDSVSVDTTTLVFVSENIENIPPDWRAKVQYEIIDKNEFIELFKLAPPGEAFEVFWETHFTRKDL